MTEQPPTYLIVVHNSKDSLLEFIAYRKIGVSQVKGNQIPDEIIRDFIATEYDLTEEESKAIELGYVVQYAIDERTDLESYGKQWLIKSATAFHKIPVKDVRFATDRPDLEKKLP